MKTRTAFLPANVSSGELCTEKADAPHYLSAATSENTRRAYQGDIRHFESWGGRLPATTQSILKYLHAFADTLNPRTLARRLTALRQWHRCQQFPDPTTPPLVAKTMAGILRVHGRPKKRAHPLLPEHLIQIVRYLTSRTGLGALRDVALLQTGFLGAFRRSELAAIRYEHISWQPEGIEILIPRSKTDPTGEGQYCVIPTGNSELCAVRGLKHWLEAARIESGYVFRRIFHGSRQGDRISEMPVTPVTINNVLKRRADEAGLENSLAFSSHSMRRGLASTASRSGVSIPAIMRQGRWKQVDTVMEYIEAAQRFSENAAAQVLGKMNPGEIDS